MQAVMLLFFPFSQVPARSLACKHLECFDLLSHLRNNAAMHLKMWRCPICKRSASWNELIVDKYGKMHCEGPSQTSHKYSLFLAGMPNIGVFRAGVWVNFWSALASKVVC